ncbi:MAG: aldolase/citrate lyase family protein [Dehalococcoidia bacterium]|nr:aldolase/citrate lyase family protein [Dehalococcoidia bacterium]
MAQLRVNKAKNKLARGEVTVALASWGYGGADALERLIDLEPDAIWLEGEHGEVDFSNIGELTRAIDLIGASPIVRVHQNQAGVIYRTLDLGAQGICVPHVNTREEAEAVVQAGKFAPIGLRGSYTSRQGIGVPNYQSLANDQTMLIILIEDIVAVENLDEILKVDDIDVFFVAPGDLAQTMGHIGEPHHPDVQAVVDESLRRIVAAGRTAGALVSNENAEHHLEQGVKFFLGAPGPWIQNGLVEMNRRAEA